MTNSDVASVFSWPELVAMGTDVVIALCAVAAAVIAWIAGSAWRAQIRGNREFEVAFSMRRQLLRFRDELKKARNRDKIIFNLNCTPFEQVLNEKNFCNTLNSNTPKLLDPVRESLSDLQSMCYDAESLYEDIGPEIRALVDRLETDVLHKVENYRRLLATNVSNEQNKQEQDQRLPKNAFNINFHVTAGIVWEQYLEMQNESEVGINEQGGKFDIVRLIYRPVENEVQNKFNLQIQTNIDGISKLLSNKINLSK